MKTQIKPTKSGFLWSFAIFLLLICGLESRGDTATPPLKAKAWPRLIRERTNFNGIAMGFSPNGKTFVAQHAGALQLWDTRRWVIKSTIKADNPSALAFSPDGKTIAISCGNNRLEIWEARTGKYIKTLPGLRRNVAFSPDGALMAGTLMTEDGETGQSLIVWDARTGKRIGSFPNDHNHHSNHGFFSFSPDNTLLASASDYLNAGNIVEIWNLRTGKLVSSTEGRGDAAAPVVFAPDGRTFATAGVDPHWEPPPPDPEGPCCTDGGYFVDYSAKLWDVRTGKLRRIFKGWTTQSVFYAPLAFTASGKMVIYGDTAASDGRNVDFLDSTTGKKLGVIDHVSDRAVLSPDGKTFVVGGQTLRVWSLQ